MRLIPAKEAMETMEKAGISEKEIKRLMGAIRSSIAMSVVPSNELEDIIAQTASKLSGAFDSERAKKKKITLNKDDRKAIMRNIKKTNMYDEFKTAIKITKSYNFNVCKGYKNEEYKTVVYLIALRALDWFVDGIQRIEDIYEDEYGIDFENDRVVFCLNDIHKVAKYGNKDMVGIIIKRLFVEYPQPDD